MITIKLFTDCIGHPEEGAVLAQVGDRITVKRVAASTRVTMAGQITQVTDVVAQHLAQALVLASELGALLGILPFPQLDNFFNGEQRVNIDRVDVICVVLNLAVDASKFGDKAIEEAEMMHFTESARHPA